MSAQQMAFTLFCAECASKFGLRAKKSRITVAMSTIQDPSSDVSGEQRKSCSQGKNEKKKDSDASRFE